MSRQSKDLTGHTYGRLTVMCGNGPRHWLCSCECGQSVTVRSDSLRDKRRPTRSCGCLRRERLIEAHTTHGRYAGIDQSVKEGRTLRAILQRCYDENHPKYYLYGGRFGRPIKVCDRWQGAEGYRNFLADMGPCPGLDHSIDRIDPDGDYCPENCRWITKAENSSRARHGVRFKPHETSAEIGLYVNAELPASLPTPGFSLFCCGC